MFGVLDEVQINRVLSENIVGRLGCHADGKTYVVPVSYAYSGQYIYARSFEGLKITMMRENPNVCFQIDQMEDMADWQSVIVWGAYEELSDAGDRDNGLKILQSRILPTISSETVKLSPEWPFPANDLSRVEGIVFRIKITEKTGRCESLDSAIHER